MQLGVHAYAWTSEWNDSSLELIGRAKRLGLDLIEVPLMRLDLCNPQAIRDECERVGIGVCTSTVLNEATDITADSEAVRNSGVEYLKGCVKATADMGGNCFSGVIYSQIGKKADTRPGNAEWKNSASCLKEACRYAQDLGVTVGIEPVNWLLCYKRLCKFVRLPSSVGIEPVSWLVYRKRYCKFVRFPSSVGIEPVSWLFCK